MFNAQMFKTVLLRCIILLDDLFLLFRDVLESLGKTNMQSSTGSETLPPSRKTASAQAMNKRP